MGRRASQRRVPRILREAVRPAARASGPTWSARRSSRPTRRPQRLSQGDSRSSRAAADPVVEDRPARPPAPAWRAPPSGTGSIRAAGGPRWAAIVGRSRPRWSRHAPCSGKARKGRGARPPTPRATSRTQVGETAPLGVDAHCLAGPQPPRDCRREVSAAPAIDAADPQDEAPARWPRRPARRLPPLIAVSAQRRRRIALVVGAFRSPSNTKSVE